MKVVLLLCVVAAVVAHPNVHSSVKHLVSDLHDLEEERGTTCAGFAASPSLNPDHKKIRPKLRDAACMTTGVRNFCGDFCFADTCGDFAKGNGQCELNPKAATEFCSTAADVQRKQKTPAASLGDFETFPECSRKCCLPKSTCTSYNCKKGSTENEAHSSDTCFVTTQEHPKSCQKHCCSPDNAPAAVEAPRVSRSNNVRCDKYATTSRTCTAVRPGLESYECDKSIAYTDKASAQYSCEDVCCAKTCGDVGYDPNPPAPRRKRGGKAPAPPKPAEGMCKLKADTPVGTVCEQLSDPVHLEILFGPPGGDDDELIEFQDIVEETQKTSLERVKASPCSECCQEAITCEAFGDGCGQNRKNKMDQTACDRDGKQKGSCFQECCFTTVVACEEVIPEIRKRGGYCPASTRRKAMACGHNVIDQLLGKDRHLYKECVDDCCDDIRVMFEGEGGDEDYEEKYTDPVNCATYGAAMADQVCPDPEVDQDFDQDSW